MIIIPAKGTSRRAPGKNRRWFHLLMGEICGGEIVVSTDDLETAHLAGLWKVGMAPRPTHLTGSDITVENVCRDVLGRNKKIKQFCVMLPTAALVSGGDIDRARRLLTGRIDTVIAVARHERQGTRRIPDSRGEWLVEHHSALADCGAFIWCKTAPFMKRQSFYDSKNIAVYVLPFGRGQDVDTVEDMERVDALLRI